MFTVQQMKAAHAKVKTGADFPGYVKEIKQLGLIHYDFMVKDGSTFTMVQVVYRLAVIRSILKKQFQKQHRLQPLNRSYPNTSKVKAISLPFAI